MAQNTCDKHDNCVVVYETRHVGACPFCSFYDKYQDLMETVKDLKSEIDSLERTNQDLESRLLM